MCKGDALNLLDDISRTCTVVLLRIQVIVSDYCYIVLQVYWLGLFGRINLEFYFYCQVKHYIVHGLGGVAKCFLFFVSGHGSDCKAGISSGKFFSSELLT